jgi:hypothetical protein
MKRYISLLFAGLCIAAWSGCKKYEIEPLVKDPAYVRVFNDLTSTTDLAHGQQVTPFLTFLMDPQTDAAGIPVDAAVVGDFLGTRQLFSLSYAANEANSSVGNNTTGGPLPQPDPPNLTPIKYEYPGNAHVLTAPVINGFDLSAWAQVPSGKHRIMFVIRPQNGIVFTNLSSSIRSGILLDTTIELEKGEVYTLEVVSRDPDNGKYGLYIRREQFIHQPFEANKLYAGFVNLSGERTEDAQNGFLKVFPDKIKITASYFRYNDAASAGGNVFYTPVPGYSNTYLTTLSTRMDTTVSYHPLPMLPQSDFFFQGLLRTYANVMTSEPSKQGTLPYFKFQYLDADVPAPDPSTGSVLLTNCSADPAVYNNYNPATTNVRAYAPNLNLVVNNKGAYQVYPTVNIMEIVYDRVFLMQIARGFEQLP